jgi:hypothetical protein
MRSPSKQPKQDLSADNIKANGRVEEVDDTFLPPRNVVHPTEKEKWLRGFYLSLLWLFILLVAGLLFWGWQRLNGEA